MQEDPVYDYPDPHPVGEKRVCPQRGSLKSISVLDRLLLTYPVWLQLSINSATALHILQREPPGTFLVRKSNTSQKKMLCVRLADESVPSFVKQFVIREKDSKFWSSQLNFRGPRNGPPPVADGSLLQKSTLPDCAMSISESSALFQEFCQLRTRSPSELDMGAGQGALCFINPLFLQDHPAMHKRHHFKRSVKVRVSTENTSSLSPPVSPPPPPPLLAKAKVKGKNLQHAEVVSTAEVEPTEKPEALGAVSDYLQPCVTLPKKASTIVMPTLSPTVEEDDYQLPKALQQARQNVSVAREQQDEDEDEEIGLVMEQQRIPSLSELESSSSLSSLDEAEEGPERPPLTRGTSNPTVASLCLPRQSASALRKMSAAFVSFFVPGKRVARLVEDLSRDRRMAFGTLVQDFLRQQREVLKPQFLTSSVELLQGMRIFISQAKVFLLECGELEPPIDMLVPEDEKDQTLEKALFRCVLKPLKRQIDEALHVLHERDGCSTRIAESMQRARKASPCDLFGVQVTVPDTQGIDKLRRKMSLVRRAYSPIDKLHLLLQICKLIYKAMKNNAGQEFGADDFLPALSYVIVQCNMPELSVEVEYMMELLDTSWLTGEGGYYLTSVYASLSFIQSLPEAVAPTALTQEVRESLKNWSHRRRTDNKSHKDLLQQNFVKVVFQDGECSLMKTLQWKAGTSAETLAQLCAVKFGVNQPEEYSLYWRRDGELEPLPPTAYIQDLQSLGTTSAPFIYQCSGQDMKSRKLTRGGALDLSAEAS
ncbi:hypothetical protein P4O66_016637 [Electrophorus voltai]|uniref:Ras and Rab interactor 2 n=1 Tax=Electrophorus voltai TaxID=2609070 RepID=A0AAD8YWC4_9TELE|nr:hypothetical protein P4O66_016637 [Electrophorus voltai]